jgi:hypothetical protein
MLRLRLIPLPGLLHWADNGTRGLIALLRSSLEYPSFCLIDFLYGTIWSSEYEGIGTMVFPEQKGFIFQKESYRLYNYKKFSSIETRVSEETSKVSRTNLH